MIEPEYGNTVEWRAAEIAARRYYSGSHLSDMERKAREYAYSMGFFHGCRSVVNAKEIQLRAERDRLLKLNEALAEKLDEVCAQRDTAMGYGSDAGVPPWMK